MTTLLSRATLLASVVLHVGCAARLCDLAVGPCQLTGRRFVSPNLQMSMEIPAGYQARSVPHGATRLYVFSPHRTAYGLFADVTMLGEVNLQISGPDFFVSRAQKNAAQVGEPPNKLMIFLGCEEGQVDGIAAVRYRYGTDSARSEVVLLNHPSIRGQLWILKTHRLEDAAAPSELNRWERSIRFCHSSKWTHPKLSCPTK